MLIQLQAKQTHGSFLSQKIVPVFRWCIKMYTNVLRSEWIVYKVFLRSYKSLTSRDFRSFYLLHDIFEENRYQSEKKKMKFNGFKSIFFMSFRFSMSSSMNFTKYWFNCIDPSKTNTWIIFEATKCIFILILYMHKLLLKTEAIEKKPFIFICFVTQSSKSYHVVKSVAW